MSDVTLLDKTRKIGQLLHNNSAGKVAFSDICEVCSEILKSNVLVISFRGKLLGAATDSNTAVIDELITHKTGELIDEGLNGRFMRILSTQDNLNLLTLGFSRKKAEGSERYHACAVPIFMNGERLGTLFFYKNNGWYDIDDVILCEYAATVVGLEMMRSMDTEQNAEEHMANGVRSAIDSLTASEKAAIKCLLKGAGTEERLIVAGQIAEESGVTRSVAVNAIRKLGSAGVIKTRSAGVKGTRVLVTNELILEELKKI